MTRPESSARYGILGGTFNPPHLGHLILAQDAAEAFSLDQVWFLPCAQPAHKPGAHLAPASDRVRMLEAALHGKPHWQLCLEEIERDGVSYSIDTVRVLREQHPDVDWHFIIGADTLVELHSWKDIEGLLPLCQFITMRRPGAVDPDDLRQRIQLPSPWPAMLIGNLFPGHLIDISSTEIRKRVALGHSIRYLVPPEVEEHIVAQRLYQTNETAGEVSSNRSI